MSAIVHGYEYDIFISYRHNDNRSGWVTEFVNALQEELAATIKEPLSIYFDKNPHDGLLETHNVDKSLEGKLKCLIFIPIISQTYCDPKSFAWQHEFCAFNRMCNEDAPLSSREGPGLPARQAGVRSFGRDVKLSNGNVASRILPVKIHDLDVEDQSTIENELGCALRAIEFIFKEPGVNRPLAPDDNQEKNIIKTKYKNQVNKVANAVKEIITVIKNPISRTLQTNNYQPTTITEKSKSKYLLTAAVVFLLLIITYFIYPKFNALTQPDKVIDKSIAVLPFVNMSGDPEQDYFSDGLSEELLNLLSRVPDLKVIARTSSFAFKGTNEDIRSIGEKLGVAQILEGSVRQSGDKVRITAQLIRVKDGTHLWSKTYDRLLDDILIVQDEIAAAIVRSLNSTFRDEQFRTKTNPEAHHLIMQGDYYWDRDDSLSRRKALEFFESAYRIDSLNGELLANLSGVYYSLENPKADAFAKKAIALDPENPTANWAMGLARVQAWDWLEADRYLDKAITLNPIAGAQLGMLRNAERLGKEEVALRIGNDAMRVNPYGRMHRYFYTMLLIHQGKFDQALLNAQKLKELNSPTWPYEIPAEIYLLQGKPDMALKEVIQIPSGHKAYAFFSCLTYWSMQQKKQANEELKKYIDRFKNSSAFSIAEIYAWRGENQEALKWLEVSFQRRENDLLNINTSSWMRSMKNDAGYQAILKKMNLPLLK